MRRALPVIGLLSLLFLAGGPEDALADDDLVRVVSTVTYDVRPDTGPVHVTWDVNFQNDDPNTRVTDGAFYRSLSVPVLAGASNLAATADGETLDTTAGDAGGEVLTSATVEFAEPIYYRGDYAFTLSYDLAEVREPSVLVTPNYVFIPIIGAGDEATIIVNTPTDEAWPATLEAGDDCTQEGNTFRCSGSDTSYLAATTEVSRPSAVTTTAFQVPLRESTIGVNVTFFLGEDAFAAHLQNLTTAALPLIEAEYGFPYRGTPALTIAQGGRQSVLGYEGLTNCDGNGCHVTVSPGAFDVTLIHELAHLWSGIYSERWLGEGFAQLVAEDVAAQLPDVVGSTQPERGPATVPLLLDDWGNVSGLIGASDEEQAVENAGYDLSLRFLYQLRFETGAEALRITNAAIAAGGTPVNSRAYLDAFENSTGLKIDSLFGDWVFGPSYDTILSQRRDARAGLSDLNARLAEAGLSTEATATIESHIAAWRFADALAELATADAAFATYEQITAEIEAFRLEATENGLTSPDIASEELTAWKFQEARLELERARQAMQAYVAAKAIVESDRNLLERFGLLAKDPEGSLNEAATAFAAGEFDRSRGLSSDARDIVEDSDMIAMQRFAIVFGIAGFFALVVLAVVWFSRNREHEFA